MIIKKIIRPAAVLATALCAAAAPPPSPQWPAAPDPPRLRYLEEIRFPQALESREKNKLGSWLQFFLGVESEADLSNREDSLLQPTGLFVRDGILYVADPARAAVLRYDLARRKGAWLSKPKGLTLASPVGVAASSDGRIYVLDSSLRKVFIFDAQGSPVGELRGDPLGLGHPAGLAVSDRRVYVSDVLNHRIVVFGLEGVFVDSFGKRGKEPGEFNYPTYLWFDRNDGQLWVTDSENFRLQWFDPDGKPLGLMGSAGNRPGYLARPRGVARDSEGHVYVSEGAFDALQLFDARGRLLLFVGMAGILPGQFNLPAGVGIDEKDRVFVADTQNQRVQVFQYIKEGAQ